MNAIYKNLSALALAALITGACESQARTYNLASEGVQLSLTAPRLPVFPQSLLREGYTEGVVRVAFDVDQTGQLRDWFAIEATHPEFAAAVGKAMDTWTFSPPTANGEARAVVGRFQVNFRASGTAISFSGPDFNALVINELSGYKRDEVKLVRYDDLDTPIKPVHMVSPAIPTDMAAANDGASAVFTFYIDSSGRVRVPALDHLDGDVDPDALLATQEALSQWTFERPTVNSKPAVVRVAQEFVFRAR